MTRGGVGSTADPDTKSGNSEINSYYPGPLNAYQGVSSVTPTIPGQPLEGQLDIRSSPDGMVLEITHHRKIC